MQERQFLNMKNARGIRKSPFSSWVLLLLRKKSAIMNPLYLVISNSEKDCLCHFSSMFMYKYLCGLCVFLCVLVLVSAETLKLLSSVPRVCIDVLLPSIPPNPDMLLVEFHRKCMKTVRLKLFTLQHDFSLLERNCSHCPVCNSRAQFSTALWFALSLCSMRGATDFRNEEVLATSRSTVR